MWLLKLVLSVKSVHAHVHSIKYHNYSCEMKLFQAIVSWHVGGSMATASAINYLLMGYQLVVTSYVELIWPQIKCEAIKETQTMCHLLL